MFLKNYIVPIIPCLPVVSGKRRERMFCKGMTKMFEQRKYLK